MERMMETNVIYRGRLIDHVQLVVKDLARSRIFYDSIFAVLNIPLGGQEEGFFWFDELCVTALESAAAQGVLTGRSHLAFQAKDEAMVKAFHAQGLKAGGTDNGKPGERSYHPGYYAAFLLDPDGNNIEAVYHGAAESSADSIVIRF